MTKNDVYEIDEKLYRKKENRKKIEQAKLDSFSRGTKKLLTISVGN